MQKEQLQTQQMMMFHQLTGLPIIRFDSNLHSVISRWPKVTVLPTAQQLELIQKANNQQTRYQVFAIQRASLFGLLRITDGYLLIWSQPLPIYQSSLSNNAYPSDGARFLPQIIAALQQLALNVTNVFPTTDNIRVTSISLPKVNVSVGEYSDTAHNSFDAEAQMLNALAQADVKDFESKYDHFLQSGQPGKLNASNSIRNQKNLAIVSTTIFTRAVLQAGVLPEVAYRLSDHYILSIESETQIDDLRNYILDIGLGFINLIQHNRQRGTLPIIIKTRDYISKHLHQMINITTLANQQGTSASYLNRIFKKSTGETLGEYITNQRMTEACNLLIYSSDSIADIGLFVGYSSPAYFSRRFTQIIGSTPKDYRNNNQNNIFLNHQ